LPYTARRLLPVWGVGSPENAVLYRLYKLVTRYIIGQMRTHRLVYRNNSQTASQETKNVLVFATIIPPPYDPLGGYPFSSFLEPFHRCIPIDASRRNKLFLTQSALVDEVTQVSSIAASPRWHIPFCIANPVALVYPYRSIRASQFFIILKTYLSRKRCLL
jgi:hypothetical protein